MTPRTDAILRAIHAQLVRHGVEEDKEIQAVICEIRLSPGQGHPRSVIVNLRYEVDLNGGHMTGKPA